MKIITFGSSSSGNSYLVHDGDSSLVLEAGVNPSKMKLDWTGVDGVLISHEHGDHSKFAKQVIKRCGADIYCTKGTAQFLEGVPDYRIKHLIAKQPMLIKDWQVLPFDTQHDVAEPVGFLIVSPSGKKLLFATDTFYVKYKFSGLTHLMIECNFSIEIARENLEEGRLHKGRYKRILESHFEIGTVIDFLKANDLSKLEEIHLLHLSDSNSDADQFKEKIRGATGVPVYVAGED